MIVITGAQRNSSIGRTSGNTRLSTGSMGSLYWHLAQLMWEDSSRETASVIVLRANYYPSLVYNLCYKTHPVRLYSAFPCSPHTLLSGRFECVCLSVHEGSSTAGNTWGRHRSHYYSQTSLIPFPDISILSPEGDTDKGRSRPGQHNCFWLSTGFLHSILGRLTAQDHFVQLSSLKRLIPAAAQARNRPVRCTKRGSFLPYARVHTKETSLFQLVPSSYRGNKPKQELYLSG